MREGQDPEELLRRVEAEERRERRGRLKIFLGYAPGVGKSYRMFDEGRRRKQRGQDVVVAAVQLAVPPDVQELLRGFEVLPLQYGRLDLDALRQRRPAICLIDGLAYANPPGSRHAERWQDVEALLDGGISVITTINLQYVRDRQPQVEAIRGKRVTDGVPEAFFRQADDIEVVDAPPRADPGQRQLAELREIALLLAAEVVDAQLDAYLKEHGVAQTYGTQERVLVCLTPRSNAALMIERGRRQADRFHGELFAIYVEQHPLAAPEREQLHQHLALARAARAQVEVLPAGDFVSAVLAYARQHGITQIFAGHSQRNGFWRRFRANPVERLIAAAEGIDVRVFPHAASPR